MWKMTTVSGEITNRKTTQNPRTWGLTPASWLRGACDMLDFKARAVSTLHTTEIDISHHLVDNKT